MTEGDRPSVPFLQLTPRQASTTLASYEAPHREKSPYREVLFGPENHRALREFTNARRSATRDEPSSCRIRASRTSRSRPRLQSWACERTAAVARSDDAQLGWGAGELARRSGPAAHGLAARAPAGFGAAAAQRVRR